MLIQNPSRVVHVVCFGMNFGYLLFRLASLGAFLQRFPDIG